MRFSKFYAFCAALFVMAFVMPVHAQVGQPAPVTKPAENPQVVTPPPIDILPAKTANTKGLIYSTDDITHPEVKMTPDKSELIRLDGKAASIIIGNPQHLSIVAESPTLLVLTPKAPGATYFTVLDSTGAILMQRHVLVDSPKEKYMRVRKSCTNSKDKNCQSTNVYYCPDMCHRILIDDASEAQQQGSAASAESSNDAEPAPEEPAPETNPNATVEKGAEPQ